MPDSSHYQRLCKHKLELFQVGTIIPPPPPHPNTSSWDRLFEMGGFTGIFCYLESSGKTH